MRRPLIALALATLALPAMAAPETLKLGQTLQGTLTADDSPRDDGGVSRDYKVQAEAGSFIIVSMKSEEIDGIVSAFNPDRTKAGENDDRAEGNYDPLLTIEATQTGTYTIRVGSLGSGEQTVGAFSLKVVSFKE